MSLTIDEEILPHRLLYILALYVQVNAEVPIKLRSFIVNEAINNISGGLLSCQFSDALHIVRPVHLNAVYYAMLGLFTPLMFVKDLNKS